MKKIVVCLMGLMVASAAALADVPYVDPELRPQRHARSVQTVRDALKGHDDQWVVLRGRLSHKWGEHYTLTDSTGSIDVEIDDVGQLDIPAGALVQVAGEIDHEGVGMGWVKVEAKRVDVVNRNGTARDPHDPR